MFIITIPKWKFSNTMMQSGTRWEYFKEEECKTLFKTVTTENEQAYMLVDKESYPEGTIFYIRPTRLFPNNNKEIELRPTIVRTRPRNLKNLPMYRDGASIEKPILTFNKEDLDNDNLPSFNVNSSIFQATQASHLLTNWIIEDLNGVVLETNLNNKIDLTQISIRKILLERNRGIKVKCQHVGDNLEASSFGILTLELRGGEQFNIVREYEDVDPNKDFFIPITPKEVLNDGVVKSAVFKRLNNREDETGEYTAIDIDLTTAYTEGGFTLKREYITPDSTFVLEVFSQDKEGNIISTKTMIKMRPSTPTKNYDVKDEIKLVSIEDRSEVENREVNVADFYFSEYDYGKFRSGNDKSPYLFSGSIEDSGRVEGDHVLDKRITLFNTQLNDLRLTSSTGCDGALILNGKDYVIVDSPRSNNGSPMLKVYKLDPVKDTFNIFGKTCERQDETTSIGKIGSFFLDHASQTLYYAPEGIRKMRRINLIEQKMEEIDIDANIKEGYFIHNPKFNKTLWIGTDGYLYIQEGWSDEFEQGANLPFKPEVTRFKFILMNNDDTLVIALNGRSEIVSIHRYEASTSKFIEIDITPISKYKAGIQFKGIIKGYRKEIYIQCYDGNKFQWFRYV